jgi:ribosomal protein S18 acetylase RimI-like enzyme
MTKVRADVMPQHILDVLTLGFSADPIMRWLFPEAHLYLAHFPRLVRLFGGDAFDKQTALCVDDGAAAALWLPPLSHPDGDGLMALLESVLPSDVFEDACEVIAIMDEMHPDEPCWHLAFVATDPVSRRKGYGSALIEHLLPRCDAERKVAYLENTNPANTAFYQRHGFRVIGEMQAGQSPPMYAMQRDPR